MSWNCKICKKPEITKGDGYIIIGCKHLAVYQEKRKDEIPVINKNDRGLK